MELLEYLQHDSGEEVMSNLNGRVLKKYLPKMFAHVVKLDAYSLEEWNDALEYILVPNERIHVDSIEDLKHLLKRKDI